MSVKLLNNQVPVKLLTNHVNRRLYKLPLLIGRLSFAEVLWLMSQARVLTEHEFDEIVADLREQFERRLKILSEEKIQASVVGHARFHLMSLLLCTIGFRDI